MKITRNDLRGGAIGAILLIILGLGFGCAKASEPFHDADRGTQNDSPADTGTMPDGFSNYATKCDHGNRVYIIFKSDASYGSIDVVPSDPSC